jgi:hypothetical protein
MAAPYLVTHLLSYSPQHPDAVSVDKAVALIKNWDHALVGSVCDLKSVLLKIGYSVEDIANTLHFAFLNSPIDVTKV